MKHWHWTCVALLVTGMAQQSISQDHIPKLPAGVNAATLAYAVADSGDYGYDNSGKTKNKVETTGLGPLFNLAYTIAGQNAIGGVVADNFNAIKLRTRGDVYGMAYHHGVEEDVTVEAKFRWGNLVSRVNHKDDPAFAQYNLIAPIAQVDQGGDVDMNDRLVESQVGAAFWMDDEYLDDDTKHQSAVVVGITDRATWNTGPTDLLGHSLADLARMNRPPFMRVGYQGTMTDDYDGVALSYGAHLHYHMRGRTRQVNPAIILSNSNAFGLIPGGPQTTLPAIEGIESVGHYGGAVDFNVSMPLDEERATQFGVGFWAEYENNHKLRDPGLSGNTTLDDPVAGFGDPERVAETRGFLRLSLTHSTVEQYKAGTASIPYIVSLKIDDSIYGRNMSVLRLASVRFTMPLSSPEG